MCGWGAAGSRGDWEEVWMLEEEGVCVCVCGCWRRRVCVCVCVCVDAGEIASEREN